MKLAGLSGSMKDKKETERGWTSGGIEGGTLDENKSLDEQTEEAEAKIKQVRSLCHSLEAVLFLSLPWSLDSFITWTRISLKL